MKKTKLTRGDVCAVPLPGGGYGIGVCCGDDFAFMAVKVNKPIMPEKVLELNVAFRVFVALDAATSGGWQHLGRVELTGAYAHAASYLNKPVGSEQLYIYCAGERRPANQEECRGLELVATWFSFHVAERLEDFFAGRDNRYIRAMRKQLEIDF